MAADVSKLFWWLNPVKKIVLAPFWWALVMFFVFWLPYLRVWWWFIAPVLLAIELRKLYLWWINWDYAYAKKRKWVVLEVVPPKEILTPLKAMDDVFNVLWGPLYNVPNWRERWMEGELDDAPGWMSWEVVSIEGELHFYLRVPDSHRHIVESTLYSHYPELEINQVPDYVKNVPQNIPNAEWDVYGEDFILKRPAAYPIKTYEKFFEPQGERIAAEEKRIDPIGSLLEMMSKLGKGEQFWLQFITMSVSKVDEPAWEKEAAKIVGKIARRSEKKVITLWQYIQQTVRDLILGPTKEGSGEKATYKWEEIARTETEERELLLTPGEREIVTEIENKLKKPVYRTSIRGLYIARRESFKPSNKILTRSYFTHFQTQNLNYLMFSIVTRPKTQYVFRKHIPFIRARKMFKNAVLRFPPLFPDRKGECAILNTEELATLFHFPIKVTGLVLPTMARVESKKSGPPPNLPVE